MHAYISSSSAPQDDRLIMEGDSAYYHVWHSTDLRGWDLDFPVVRGEAGMDPIDSMCRDCLGIDQDIQGVWAHNYVWSTIDSGALYELYSTWWAGDHGHVVRSGIYDHLNVYKAFSDFMKDIPLSNGHYEDLAATISDERLRAWGQKDLANGRAHLWIQNKNHTWRNAVNGVFVLPVYANLTMLGFQPGASYTVEWWDTYAGQSTSSETVVAKSDGSITLGIISVDTDIAAKIRRSS